TRCYRDWSSEVCSSDLLKTDAMEVVVHLLPLGARIDHDFHCIGLQGFAAGAACATTTTGAGTCRVWLRGAGRSGRRHAGYLPLGCGSATLAIQHLLAVCGNRERVYPLQN